jgi:hypothetical protein
MDADAIRARRLRSSDLYVGDHAVLFRFDSNGGVIETVQIGVRSMQGPDGEFNFVDPDTNEPVTSVRRKDIDNDLFACLVRCADYEAWLATTTAA